MIDDAAGVSSAPQGPGCRARRQTRLVLVIVALAVVVAGLVPMRLVAGVWSGDDVEQCRASAVVEQAVAAGPATGAAAMTECRRHRRNQRWGPWGVFGTANDGSPYTLPDD